MFRVFAAHAATDGILMFNAGFSRGEAVGSYRGDPLYHASLDPSEYEALLKGVGFRLIEHSINDPAKGGRIYWIAQSVLIRTITAMWPFSCHTLRTPRRIRPEADVALGACRRRGPQR
jgi:hypothetical protein